MRDYLCWPGFVEKEIKKANIPTVDTGENPEVPFPRDMIDLEVIYHVRLFFPPLIRASEALNGQPRDGMHDI